MGLNEPVGSTWTDVYAEEPLESGTFGTVVSSLFVCEMEAGCAKTSWSVKGELSRSNVSDSFS
jgi:hypothetical protein